MVAQALRLALAVVAVLLTSATWAGPTLTLTEHDFQNNIEATDRITYHAAVAGHSGVYGSDETVPNASLAIPAGANGTCSVTFTNLPDHVSMGHISFNAHVEGNFGAQTPGGPMVAWSGGGSLNQTFVTYSAPTASQEVPWVDVLGFTCAWAMGSDTEAEVVVNTTMGLYTAESLPII